jgi:hypothetical protein
LKTMERLTTLLLTTRLTTGATLATGFGATFLTTGFGTTFFTTGFGAAFTTGFALATTFALTGAAFFTGAALTTGFVAFATAFVATFLTATVLAGAFFPTAKVKDGGVKAAAVLARMAKSANFMVLMCCDKIYNVTSDRKINQSMFVPERYDERRRLELLPVPVVQRSFNLNLDLDR